MRNTGSVDFFWNYRIVDSFEVKDIMFDGFVESISADFGFLYYKKVHFKWKHEDAKEEMKDMNSEKWKNEDAREEMKDTNSEMYKKFAKVFQADPDDQ